MKKLFALLALLVLTTHAPAQCSSGTCGTRYATHATNYDTHHEDVVVFRRFIAVIPLLDLPTYSALPYAPPAPAAAERKAPAPAPETGRVEKKLDDIALLLRDMDERVRRLEKEREPKDKAPEKKAPEPKKEEKKLTIRPRARLRPSFVAAGECALCHVRGRESNGGDFVLTETDGSFRRFDKGELDSITRVLAKKTMPKLTVKDRKLQEEVESADIHALSDEERASLLEEVQRQLRRIEQES